MLTKQLTVDTFTGETVETELFYPTVRFKGGGGGSTTTNTIDYAYNARMAAVAEQQQNISNEYFNFYKTDYEPMERERIAANRALIPSQTAAGIAQAQADQAKATADIATAKATADLAPVAAQTKMGILQGMQREQVMAEPVMADYYKKALTGVDPNKKVAEAKADVAQSFKENEGALARSAGRYGITPGSSAFVEGLAGQGTSQAKATAAAMTGARGAADKTNFEMLNAATQTYKKNLGLGG